MTSLSVDSSTSVVAGLLSPELSGEEAVDLVLGQKSQPTITPDTSSPVSHERKLGDSELSFYLHGRATGVNDMYLHLGFKSPERIMVWGRVRAAWAILRMRHPLLASRVVMRDYDDLRFVYSPPLSPEQALTEASSQLEYRHQTKDDDDIVTDYELFICAAHYIGDGIAANQFANDFFGLLSCANSQEAMEQLAADEWKQRCGRRLPPDVPLPASVEENLGTDSSRFRRVAGRIDFQNFLDKQIGGQAFPRRSDPVRHTIVLTTSFDEKKTKAMLKACKARGVSISSAMFAICNIAWARMSPQEKQELPMMMYAAMNIRPFFPKPVHDSYWFLAAGFFNIVLPNFIPASCDVSKTFWHRARKAKEQISRIANSPMIQSRSREMAIKRGKQFRAWAKEDDEKQAGVSISSAPKPTSDKPSSPPRSPSVALLGLSLLGNLDGIYKHASFPDIKLHTLTIGSRQRHSGMLLFGYTFAGKLWISLGYDENGFDRGTVDLFWANVDAAVHELLIE
ncbi:hypothetical protein H4582DRAFT_1817187 [Lactarius indigo]|nr:hypothetical protein H4582DRAFT_1817187 [Lactarius indigo]